MGTAAGERIENKKSNSADPKVSAGEEEMLEQRLPGSSWWGSCALQRFTHSL